jgi:hypothetical protein
LSASKLPLTNCVSWTGPPVNEYADEQCVAALVGPPTPAYQTGALCSDAPPVICHWWVVL